MKLHIVKQYNQFIIQNPPKYFLDSFSLEIQKSDILPDKTNRKEVKETEVFKKIKKLYEAFPDDPFIQSLMETTPPDYGYQQDKSDDDLLSDALKNKYGL
ncbi:MAG: hypothetical protein KAI29_25615 [Cyclobacteriaceae bacterium]|nr:hypothetical protein [Cyclobacteriaceae bacterium]